MYNNCHPTRTRTDLVQRAIVIRPDLDGIDVPFTAGCHTGLQIVA